jgi:DNA-directed RNA polymerase specialized sigma24 family protein
VLFEHVIADFGPAIARVAASFDANPAIREELIQDIGLAIWRSIERSSGSGTLKGLSLALLITNPKIMWLKKRFETK